MTKLLQVGNDIFEYPQQGTGQGHGEDATAWAEAVTNAITNFLGPNDILLSTVDLANGIYPGTPGAGIISGLSFNLVEVLHSNVEALVIRQYLRRIEGIAPADVNATNDQIAAVGHNLTAGQTVRIIKEDAGDLPTTSTDQLNESTVYEISTNSGDDFVILKAVGGSDIDLTSSGTATFSLQKQSIDTLTESLKVYGNYNGSDFVISVEGVGDNTLVDIDVDNTGQFNYSASPLPDQSLGQIYFKAKTIDK